MPLEAPPEDPVEEPPEDPVADPELLLPLELPVLPPVDVPSLEELPLAAPSELLPTTPVDPPLLELVPSVGVVAGSQNPSTSLHRSRPQHAASSMHHLLRSFSSMHGSAHDAGP